MRIPFFYFKRRENQTKFLDRFVSRQSDVLKVVEKVLMKKSLFLLRLKGTNRSQQTACEGFRSESSAIVKGNQHSQKLFKKIRCFVFHTGEIANSFWKFVAFVICKSRTKVKSLKIFF